MGEKGAEGVTNEEWRPPECQEETASARRMEGGMGASTRMRGLRRVQQWAQALAREGKEWAQARGCKDSRAQGISVGRLAGHWHCMLGWALTLCAGSWLLALGTWLGIGDVHWWSI
ncbi:unnamed protein product, partial [Ilex paraguariensis]